MFHLHYQQMTCIHYNLLPLFEYLCLVIFNENFAFGRNQLFHSWNRSDILLTYIRKWKPQKPHFCHFRSIFIRYTFPYIFALKLYIHISLSVISMHLHKVPHLILFHLQKIWTNWGINVFWSLCLAFPADVRWKKKPNPIILCSKCKNAGKSSIMK